MKNFGIKTKLIILFIFFKVIPLIVVSYMAIQGAFELKEYFQTNTKTLFEQNKRIIDSTANIAIKDSIEALDKTSQTSIEKLSVSLANSIAEFLYERDKDILFLSSIEISQKNLESFYKTKTKPVLVHEDYIYDDKTNKWISSSKPKVYSSRNTLDAKLKDNKKEFHFVDPLHLKTKQIPIYKELSFFNTKGIEIYKKSSINPKKLDISKKQNTYIKAEDYFKKIQTLKDGEIYVSDVIGEYVPSNIIGDFTKEKAKKMGIEFKPELYGYAGVENPKGKRFEGIIRFITPIFKGNQKLGYISLALDHRHIMEFTDTFDPINPNIKQNIANAGDGNYAFMWDYKGRNISHSRDYFIMGYDSKTGQRVPGWLSLKVLEDFKNSNEKDLNEFLKSYPTFDKQSLDQKPNLAQVKESGEVGLDCRYLNFAPQCGGWMQVTQNGGYGSFIIFWSNVWKLTTAATIPYYTGKYANSKRGFGFVTIGANVDEFHEAANKTKKNIDKVLETQNKKLEISLEENKNKISKFISTIVNELTFITFIMIILVILLAIWMSNYITSKTQKLIKGTQHFSKNDLDYKIEVTSNDEIGKLETAFNEMAQKLKKEIQTNKTKDTILIQKNKMAEMGDMMASILHQWKQPLNAIHMTTSSIKLFTEINQPLSDEKLKEKLEQIDKQIYLMNDTMDDFRDFFRPTQKQWYKISSTVKKVIALIDGLYTPKGIKVLFHINSDSMLNGYPNEMMQVIINLINNSRDAILENQSSIKDIHINVDKQENFTIISISDLAGGIPKEYFENIFKPYFTSKSKDKGTGIGLHLSKLIIEKVKGSIKVENHTQVIDDKEYKGARFIIKVPCE